MGGRDREGTRRSTMTQVIRKHLATKHGKSHLDALREVVELGNAVITPRDERLLQQEDNSAGPNQVSAGSTEKMLANHADNPATPRLGAIDGAVQSNTHKPGGPRNA